MLNFNYSYIFNATEYHFLNQTSSFGNVSELEIYTPDSSESITYTIYIEKAKGPEILNIALFNNAIEIIFDTEIVIKKKQNLGDCQPYITILEKDGSQKVPYHIDLESNNKKLTIWLAVLLKSAGTKTLQIDSVYDTRGNIMEPFIWNFEYIGTNSIIQTKYSTIPINIYPNPAKNLLNIEPNTLEQKIMSVTISNMSGNIVYNNNYIPNNRLTINLKNIATGAYNVTIYTQNMVYNKRIVLK
jgi:hypothetical protein